MFAVSVEEPADRAKVRDFAKVYAFPSALVGDARIEGFGRIWALPLTFLVDRHCILRKSDWTGGEKIDAASLDRIVLPLLQEPWRPPEAEAEPQNENRTPTEAVYFGVNWTPLTS